MNTLLNYSRIPLVKLTIAAALCCVAALLLAAWARQPKEIPAYPGNRVLRSAVLDGVSYKLADDGNVFRVIEERGTWTWVDRIFDPEQIAQQFVKEGDEIVTIDLETGKRYPLLKHFEDGFEAIPEGVEGLRSLIGEERQWTELTLQSPQTPSVADYVALRRRILHENASFLDASVAPSKLQAHSGQLSLHCICPAKTARMICTKASIGTGLVGFEQGDDLWFQAWFRVHGKTRPFTLVDIEGRHVKESPGIRLMLFDGQYLGVELKALNKPKYKQDNANLVPFPMDQWVEVTWHVQLHPDEGQVQVWQDKQQIVDARGPTLPFAGMLYNNLEVGISAHSFGNEPAELFVDDVLITTNALR